MGIIALISNLLAAVKAAFGFATQRDAERNAPNVQAAAEAQKEQSAEDVTKKAIADKDIEEERRELSE